MTIKESKVKAGGNFFNFEAEIKEFLQYDAAAEPIREVNPKKGPSESFTYYETIVDSHLRLFQVSLNGEYYDELWIAIQNTGISGSASYIISTFENEKEVYWTGMSTLDLKDDLREAFQVAFEERFKSKKFKSINLKENRFYKDPELTSENIINVFNSFGWKKIRDWEGRDDDLTFVKGADRISFNIEPTHGYSFTYYKDFESDNYASDYVMYAGVNLKNLKSDCRDFDNLKSKDFTKHKPVNYFFL